MLLRKSLRCWTKKRSLDSILLRKVNGIIPKDNLAAQVIGFVGIDDKGLEGVEASMDTYLRGVKGKADQLHGCQGQPHWTLRFE